jgi:hypothetical protein
MNLFTTAIVLAATLALTGCSNGPVDEIAEPPEIIEVFACSDYCPGPREQYIKRVYAGVTDVAECRKLGGHPYTYVGWGKRTICEVRQ